MTQSDPIIGRSLGHFTVIDKLGEGGMGEVYRARDGKLDRDVALKILPDELAADPERLARFEREARVLASLNHPNIATLYGSESITTDSDADAGPTTFLIMEFVEGDDLSDRLKKGFLPLEEAIDIASQVASGLEEAHERGVIHRDLKPANIMITSDRVAKILDFGLAKPYSEESSASGLSRLATVTGADDLTREGVVMGTAAYMSPEQARGRKVDRRTDVWAFGCVLFEMLTGRKAFGGDTMTDVLVSVVTGEPDWSLLPPYTPTGVRRLLRRCLRRDLRDRFRDLGDAEIELREATQTDPDEPGQSAVASQTSASLALWAFVGPLLGIVFGVALWWVIAGGSDPEPRRLRRLATISEPVSVYGAYTTSLVVSPDQSQLVYAAGSPPMLYRQMTDQLESAPVPGTDGAAGPFFSPDGRFIGFWADGALKKVPAGGGTPVTLCETNRYFFGAKWADDGFVYFSRPWFLEDGSGRVSLVRVSAEGGAVELVASAEPEDGRSVWLAWPTMLPGGEHLVATRWAGAGASPSINVISIADESIRKVVDGYQQARFLPSGHLLAGTPDGGVVALPFDRKSLEVTGEPIPVARGVHRSRYGALHFAASSDGVVFWVPDVGASRPDELVWVDRQGNAEPASSHLRDFETPRLSADGLAAVSVRSAHDSVNVWLLDLDRDTLQPVTVGVGYSRYPLWTPDGLGIVYSVPLGNADVPAGIYHRFVDGRGEPAQVVSGSLLIPTSMTPDGETVFYDTIGLDTGWNLWRGGLSAGSPHEAVVTAPFDQTLARIAPGGAWIAFEGSQSGRPEIYVRRLDSGVEGQVSPHGGRWPVWSPRGNELFYVGEESLMSIRVDLGAEPSAEPAQALFSSEGYAPSFDVSEDGQRFLMIRLGVEPTGPHINVTLDWLERSRENSRGS